MKILFLFLILSACSVPPPQPARIHVEPIPLVVMPTPPPDEWEAATSKRSKPVAKKAPVVVIAPAQLLPPCPPETGDKQKDLLRLLNCTMETADKSLPPPIPVKK